MKDDMVGKAQHAVDEPVQLLEEVMTIIGQHLQRSILVEDAAPPSSMVGQPGISISED
jgi:hypothetical protein